MGETNIKLSGENKLVEKRRGRGGKLANFWRVLGVERKKKIWG